MLEIKGLDNSTIHTVESGAAGKLHFTVRGTSVIFEKVFCFFFQQEIAGSSMRLCTRKPISQCAPN